MSYFSKVNVIRIAGLVAALAAAAVSAANGDLINAAGLIGAAASTAGLKGSASVVDAQ